MSKTKLRIVQDFVKFNEDKPKGIYLHINKDNIFEQYALIVGPKNTPYFGGFYIFKIVYPKNYPKKPPHVVMLTTDKKVRFNPNLYENGKVCLSIIGTWQGPSWEECMNIRLVLLSIQSLMTDFPIRNEPGFEETKIDSAKSIDYNQYINYYNYKVAIIDTINSINLFKTNNKKIGHLEYFVEAIIEEFKNNSKSLINDLQSYMITIGEKIVPIKTIYFIRDDHHIDFLNLNNEFTNIFSIFSCNFIEKENTLV